MIWGIPVLGYLLGSIPTAYIAGRLLKGKDIRQIGDGNVGARNAFWELGARVGVAVGLIDTTKGLLAVLIAEVANLPQVAVLITGAASVIGHTWPVFLGFRGGRGVSTSIGVLLGTVTQPTLIMAVPALATLFALRNVTKACAVLFVPLSLVCWWLDMPGALIGYSIALPCLVGLAHFIRTRQLPVRQSS